MGMLDLLKLPQVKTAINMDDCSLTLLHKQILMEKKFLRKVYESFYRDLMSHVQYYENGTFIELGSGAGFIKQMYPKIQTSDVLDLPDLDRIFDATKMPFKNNSVDAIVLINVLHHIKNIELFFAEVTRVLKETGRIVMIEPANTLWSRFVYTRFHHEVFDPNADWQVEGSRHLLDGNDALAWIIFNRDKEQFQKKYPELNIIKIYNHTPVSYLISGGFTLKQLLPSCMYVPVRCIESLFQFAGSLTGMFQTIVLERRSNGKTNA